MEPVEVRTVGELIDTLITLNIKIWHLVDAGYSGDGAAAVEAQRLNQRRTELIRALNRRLEPDLPPLPTKYYSGEK